MNATFYILVVLWLIALAGNFAGWWQLWRMWQSMKDQEGD